MTNNGEDDEKQTKKMQPKVSKNKKNKGQMHSDIPAETSVGVGSEQVDTASSDVSSIQTAPEVPFKAPTTDLVEPSVEQPEEEDTMPLIPMEIHEEISEEIAEKIQVKIDAYVQEKPKLVEKSKSDFDIIKWRRLGRKVPPSK